MRYAIPLLLALVSVPALPAQPNTIPGLDISMTSCDNATMLGRTGTFPNGRNGLAWSAALCNTGSHTVTFLAPMNADHPFFGFLFCREKNGRFEQVSDRSYSKHTFGVANGNFCGSCNTLGSTTFGPNCSDVYSVSQNGDRYWLGPADEIDPWLGVWNPVGSHFDAGEPNVGAPQNSDGNRSLTRFQTNQMDGVTHRVEVDDAVLNDPQARFFYYSFLVTAGEGEAAREDSQASREVAAEWSAGISTWLFFDQSGPVQGSVLEHWNGATVTSNSNGADDGRVYVGVNVTGPDSQGLWHYEYAVHNRDNSRGAASFRIPVCSSARVLNASAADIDNDPLNDWTVSIGSGEVAFLAGANNALEWNTIYNFSFDSDAAPAAVVSSLDQARPGPGGAVLSIPTQGPSVVHNVYLGDGCGGVDLTASGTPPLATIPNASFGLAMNGMQPGATGVILFAGLSAAVPFPNGCTYYPAGPVIIPSAPLVADPSGAVNLPLAIPNQPAFEGQSLVVQGIEVFAGGPFLGNFKLSNGLEVRLGNSLTCP